LGRIDDIGSFGIQLVEDIVTIFTNFGIESEIICASIRTPIHVLECARVGGDIATVPYKVFAQMLKHPLTDRGIEQFLEDYKSMNK
ncbi:Transaldolase, partial [Clostridium tetani]